MSDDRIIPCPACGLPQAGQYGDELWEEYEARQEELHALRSKLRKVRILLTQPDTRSSMQVTMALCEIDDIE